MWGVHCEIKKHLQIMINIWETLVCFYVLIRDCGAHLRFICNRGLLLFVAKS